MSSSSVELSESLLETPCPYSFNDIDSQWHFEIHFLNILKQWDKINWNNKPNLVIETLKFHDVFMILSIFLRINNY